MLVPEASKYCGTSRDLSEPGTPLLGKRVWCSLCHQSLWLSGGLDSWGRHLVCIQADRKIFSNDLIPLLVCDLVWCLEIYVTTPQKALLCLHLLHSPAGVWLPVKGVIGGPTVIFPEWLVLHLFSV